MKKTVRTASVVSISLVSIACEVLSNTCSVYELGGLDNDPFDEDTWDSDERWVTPTIKQSELCAVDSIKNQINQKVRDANCKMLIACTVPDQTYANKALRKLGFRKTQPTMGSHRNKDGDPVTLWHRPCTFIK